MTKLTKFSLAALVIGIVILSLIFPYYHFHWGIKPCTGLPSDASNCGDGDFGGVNFVLAGLPFVAAGVLGLLVAVIRYFFFKRRS